MLSGFGFRVSATGFPVSGRGFEFGVLAGLAGGDALAARQALRSTRPLRRGPSGTNPLPCSALFLNPDSFFLIGLDSFFLIGHSIMPGIDFIRAGILFTSGGKASSPKHSASATRPFRNTPHLPEPCFRIPISCSTFDYARTKFY